jgi:ABC-type phosphate transport system auxiliary subunit
MSKIKLIRKDKKFLVFEDEEGDTVSFSFHEKSNFWRPDAKDTMFAYIVGLWFKTMNYDDLVLNDIYIMK